MNNNDTIEHQCNFKLRSKGDEINARGEERIQAAISDRGYGRAGEAVVGESAVSR